MTRPRSLFVKSQGTHKGVVPVPHDKFKYSQCLYVAPRTLIKCKELRTKEQLAITKGLCEQARFIGEAISNLILQHYKLMDLCKQQGAIEQELLKIEVDNIAPIKHDNALRLGNHITELSFLTDKSQWRGEVADVINVVSVLEADANPLSHATHVSDKEIIRSEIAALMKHSAKLKEMRSRNEERARQRMHRLGVDADKMFDEIAAGSSKKLDDDPMTNMMMKVHENSIKMEIELQDKVEATRNRKTNLPACSYEWEVEGEKKRCTQNALPASELCKKHILISTEQKIFVPCKVCRDPCIDYGNDDPLCQEHDNPVKKLVSPGGTSRTYRMQSGQQGRPPWHNYDGNSPTQYNEVVLDSQSVFEEEEREEQERAQREKSLHKNSSPIAQKSTNARKKTWDGTVGKPSTAPTKYDPFMAAIMGTGQNTTARRRSSTLSEAQSMTCARERIFHESEFNRTRLPQHRKGPFLQPQNVRSTMMQPMVKEGQQPHGSPSETPLSTALPSSLSHSNPIPSTSIQSRIKPTNERPKIKTFGEAKESSRPYHMFPSSSSSSHQEALAKMYGKTPAFAPNMKKEQERRLPVSSTPRLPVNRSSFPLGKARGVSSDQSQGVPSGHGKPIVQSSKMGPSSNVSYTQWTTPLATSRPSHLNPNRPPPQVNSLPRESVVNKKGLPSQPASSSWGYNFQFKPVGGRSGAAQLPVRQALTDEKKGVVSSGPSVSRPSDQLMLSSSQSTTATTSNTSLPTLSLKEGNESPALSPLSSPPQLSRHATEGSSSKESDESEMAMKGTHIPFDQQIEDIEEEDDFEEEL